MPSAKSPKRIIKEVAKRPPTVIGVVALLLGVGYFVARVFSVPSDPPGWAFESPLLYCVLPPVVLAFGFAWVATYIARLIRGDEPQKHTAGPEGLGNEFPEVAAWPIRVLRRIVKSEIPNLAHRLARVEDDLETVKARLAEVDTVGTPG